MTALMVAMPRALCLLVAAGLWLAAPPALAFDAKVLDQSVLAVDFDERGFVSGLRRYTLEDGRIIDPVSRETPTLGREFGFIEQLFGNIGRFTGPPGAAQPAGP